ncbi:class I SAM-dependent methyltransferase [Mycobacterium europaeum]|uniref:class I SAM-dependent methyltransferase n=1 Tax=Mycobacterium europaeum TaxID=761804 RepID=UPI002ADFEAA0|nr:class I SAM-dependent methyltransferase [Mycobacterium europaeum]MEA1158700.1 class I SAM-dependent methyltransferase [Mycobacterium europaeum]
MQELTAVQARAYDTWFETPWGAHAWAVELAAVDDALPRCRDQIAVEVGCGTGRLVAHLAAEGSRVLGVDLSAGMLTVAAGRAPGRLVRADARRLPLPDAIADAAITIATMEFADAAAVLAELARITCPGGRIIALALNPASLWGLLDRPTRRPPFSTATYLTRRQLRRLGRRHGAARVRGRLFTAAHPKFLHHLEPLATLLGHAAPGLGAVQVLTIDTPPEASTDLR